MNFASMGSGSLPAYGVLERDYKSGMTIEEGKQLVIRAISAGITEDLGSGSQVDLCILQSGKEANLTRGVLVYRILLIY